jgi:SET domain-containing protein
MPELARFAYITRPIAAADAPLCRPILQVVKKLNSVDYGPEMPLGARLRIEHTRDRGLGVFAAEAIPKDTIVCTYAGELLSTREASEREGQGQTAYLMDSGGWTIDACRYRNVGAFINFSCEPNLELKRWSRWHAQSQKLTSMRWPVFVAKRDIEQGAELGYARDTHVARLRNSGAQRPPCHCAAKCCHGHY